MRFLLLNLGNGFAYDTRFLDFERGDLGFIAQSLLHQLDGMEPQLPRLTQPFIGNRYIENFLLRNILRFRRLES